MRRREQTDSFTSESVTEGHPDKVADQIADAVLDVVLAQDPAGRVACEVLLTPGRVTVAGEITTRAEIDIPTIARGVLLDIGYDSAEAGLDGRTCEVDCRVQRQSPEIAGAVRDGGAGDQGLMVGYACRETAALMPLPIALAHALARRLAAVRRDGTLAYLGPDGKTQVTVEYRGGRPVRVAAVVVSAQHAPGVAPKRLEADIRERVIAAAIPPEFLDARTACHINPGGPFTMGGPAADCGLTGRKLMVDTYGGAARHGGGAFSGKDPTKVDRSAAYLARHIAKTVVAAGLAERAEVQLAYAIGVADPVSVRVDTFGTARVDERRLEEAVRGHFPLRPREIIRHLRLDRPVYRATAAYGHFGREGDGFTWERTEGAAALAAACDGGGRAR
ncbi:MAG: methionine adenosyltransferase [Acidobacteria bacterium]|nr:methionine adenosyltransferase [Acidobacteriota bacterium]